MFTTLCIKLDSSNETRFLLITIEFIQLLYCCSALILSLFICYRSCSFFQLSIRIYYIIINILMDDNTKKKIVHIRELIKKENYSEALEQAEILTYKNSKLYQAHLLAGLCYDKLNKLNQAQKSYLQVLDLKPDEPNALKALSDLYLRMGNDEKSTKFMESAIVTLKNTDKAKYRQNLTRLVMIYKKNEDMEKIDKIFQQLAEEEQEISEEYVAIADAYFKTAVTNQCFFLQKFQIMGVKGDKARPLQPSAREKLNILLTDIVNYLYSVRLEYKMAHKDISNSIFQMKTYFPFASCFLKLFLLDQFCVSHAGYSLFILNEILVFFQAIYDRHQNCYLNIQTLEPETYVVSAILSYEYLAFFKQFFTLDESFNPYYQKLQSQIPDLYARRVREEYSKKISNFILKQCRTISRASETQNVQNKLQNLKQRILRLEGSYLEEVLAKMAMNSYTSYEKLDSMKNLLKLRIKNAEGEAQPHLYKYYYDYLIKIAKLYRILDEELSIYDVVEFINANDPKDFRYAVEYEWIQFGRKSKDERQNWMEAGREALKRIEALTSQLTGSIKSQAIRKKTILHILLKNSDSVLDGMKLALGTDRSFQNLQCIGFYYFHQKDYDKTLQYLKQAFVINQGHYHVNRIIFICFVKLNLMKQAYGFLQRIYEGFPNVYWINYCLAMNSINVRNLQASEKYLTSALEAFEGGVNKSYKFSYEKTIEGEQFSLFYMIDQNSFHILFDEIVIPEKEIYELFPSASSLYFETEAKIKRIRILTQLGEVLKILGRNKSSYNHLGAAYSLLQQLNEEERKAHQIQALMTTKQYATILFYVRAYKQAESLLVKAKTMCKQILKQNSFLQKYLAQTYSLLFQVSVMRLEQMMKFESYETVEEYINTFSTEQKAEYFHVKNPSLNYYKSKYQFHILCYLHNKGAGIGASLKSIEEFLRFLGFETIQVADDEFYNKLIELKDEEKILVKQCLQDYYVLKYLRQFGESDDKESVIRAEEVMPLIQLFPQSTVFYIVYGMSVEENKLKISAFLKCIQLDRQSSISVDLLASLYLKQKDYLTACKLFLKSLQIDLFNPKSYIGLCNCLFVIIGSALSQGTEQANKIIHEALNKINSYMQFMKIVDPSENYHILKFLKTLITDEPLQLFDIKANLQQSRKLTAYKYSQKLLYKMLEDCTEYLKDFNIWNKEGKEKIIEKYLKNNKIQSVGSEKFGIKLLEMIEKQLQGLVERNVENRIMIKCKLVNKLCIAANIFLKGKNIKKKDMEIVVKICGELQEKTFDQELRQLQKQAKVAILAAVIESAHYKGSNILSELQQLNKRLIFKDIITYDHIKTYSEHFPQAPLKRYIIKSLHSHPCDGTLRKSLLGSLIIVQKSANKNIKNMKSITNYRIQNAVAMNTDENANSTAKLFKKNALLYNIQDCNSWIGFIADKWEKNRCTQWIGTLQKILSNSSTNLTATSRRKAEILLSEMQAHQLISKEPASSKSAMKICSTFSSKQSDSIHYLISYIVQNYQHSPRLESIIEKCIEKSESTQKNYYRLLNFVSISSVAASTEEELVNQLKKLLQIVSDCQKDKHIHENAIVTMKCMVALLSLNYEELEQELNFGIGNRYATYSDQILINYFETIKAYREVEQNHQTEGVCENFTLFIDQMIELSKEPILKGFFCSLKAMAKTIMEEQPHRLQNQLKKALILSPSAGKSILTAEL